MRSFERAFQLFTACYIIYEHGKQPLLLVCVLASASFAALLLR